MNRSNLLFYLLPILLSACSGGDRFEEAAFQNRVDSAVNARLDSVQNSLQHRNDSLILQAAQHRADSLKKVPAPTGTSIPAVPPPPPLPQP